MRRPLLIRACTEKKATVPAYCNIRSLEPSAISVVVLYEYHLTDLPFDILHAAVSCLLRSYCQTFYAPDVPIAPLNHPSVPQATSRKCDFPSGPSLLRSLLDCLTDDLRRHTPRRQLLRASESNWSQSLAHFPRPIARLPNLQVTV